VGWFRLAGTFSDHPKVIAAGNAAVGAWVRLACWSAEHETDGFVPQEIARRFASRRELARLVVSPRASVRPLLETADDGYLLRDFLTFNPSHAQRERERAQMRERQRRHRVTEDVTPLQPPLVTLPPLHSTPYLQLENTSSPEHSARASRLRDDVIRLFALDALERELDRGREVTNRDAYVHGICTRIAQDSRVDSYVNAYTNAPASVIVAALNGETNSLRYFSAETSP